MKSTLFLAIVFTAAAARAQRSYPNCVLTDCVNFLSIAVGCGYNLNADLSAAQQACICGGAGGPSAYQTCVSCMVLDPTNTVAYDAQCSTAASVSSTRSTSVSRSSSTAAVSVSRTAPTTSPTPTAATAAVSVSVASAASRPANNPSSATSAASAVPPVATGAGRLQDLGGCIGTSCGGGDSSAANVYSTSKDTAASGMRRGVAGGAWCAVAAAAVVAFVWL